MTEQASVEATIATPAVEAPVAEAAESQKPAPTVEQVEAEWKHRVSQKDLAHNAEQKSLRDRIATLEGTTTTAQAVANGSVGEVDGLKKLLADSQKTNTQQQQQHQVDLRVVKFPAAAEALDPGALAVMDEAKLAGLEARLTAPASGKAVPVDPSSPARDSSVPRPLSEKTTKELKADLERLSPQFAAEMNNR